MKFECGDLDRALEHGQLMPEAREHIKYCQSCRKEYRLWTEISSTARELHEEWDTPALWPSIRETLSRQVRPRPERPWWENRKLWTIAAAFAICVALAVLFTGPWRPGISAPKSDQQTSTSQPNAGSASPVSTRASNGRDFLTEQALAEVERNESAYRQSIDKLSHIAASELRNPRSPVAANCSEKLKLIDSAIAETRANLDRNRYNIHLQAALADLYREKKQTLQELLTRDQKN